MLQKLASGTKLQIVNQPAEQPVAESLQQKIELLLLLLLLLTSAARGPVQCIISSSGSTAVQQNREMGPVLRSQHLQALQTKSTTLFNAGLDNTDQTGENTCMHCVELYQVHLCQCCFCTATFIADSMPLAVQNCMQQVLPPAQCSACPMSLCQGSILLTYEWMKAGRHTAAGRWVTHGNSTSCSSRGSSTRLLCLIP
jgi:hypothetical protein